VQICQADIAKRKLLNATLFTGIKLTPYERIKKGRHIIAGLIIKLMKPTIK